MICGRCFNLKKVWEDFCCSKTSSVMNLYFCKRSSMSLSRPTSKTSSPNQLQYLTKHLINIVITFIRSCRLSQQIVLSVWETVMLAHIKMCLFDTSMISGFISSKKMCLQSLNQVTFRCLQVPEYLLFLGNWIYLSFGLLLANNRLFNDVIWCCGILWWAFLYGFSCLLHQRNKSCPHQELHL